MRRVTGPIKEIIERAGVENSFFWSGVRPGLVGEPGTGQTEMSNTIPGGLATPTAPAGSAQPVWTGQYAAFLGDDWLDVPEEIGRPFPKEYTIGTVVRVPEQSSNGYFGALYGPSTGSNSRLQLWYNARDSLPDQISCSYRQGSTLGAPGIDLPANRSTLAVVATYSLTDVTLTVRGDATGDTSEVGSLAYQNETVDTANIGARLDGVNILTGDLAALLTARTVASEPGALADQLLAEYADLL